LKQTSDNSLSYSDIAFQQGFRIGEFIARFRKSGEFGKRLANGDVEFNEMIHLPCISVGYLLDSKHANSYFTLI